MNFSMPNNPANVALAAAVNKRIRADAMRQTAYASFWRMLGFGGLLLLGGTGAGAAFFGYSYITDQQATVNLSTALADALNKVTLKTDGKVTLDNPTVALNTQSIRLDTDGATVKLDPYASVKLDASTIPVMPRPSAQQLQADQQPASNVQPVTNYTVFKAVNFAKGEVVTGWSFHSNEDVQPYRQYCYYIQGGYDDNNLSMRYNIAVNGSRLQPGHGFPVNLESAFSNCVWFNGSRT